jgi:outer membrane receptor for ferrienterochelin and colicin
MRISSRAPNGIARTIALVTMAPALGLTPGTSHAQTTLPDIVVAPPAKKKGRVKAAPTPPPAAEAPPSDAAWTFGVRMAPAGGSELALDKVPANVGVVTGAQIDRAATPSLTEVLNMYIPGATINEALGNPLAADLQFRGFSASPLNGTPQGLAIYQNGIRLNEVFGDSMNWDLIPQIAISDVTVMSNNTAYGLNAMGGADNVIMKDGFTFQGATTTPASARSASRRSSPRPASAPATGPPTSAASGSTRPAGATWRQPRPNASTPTSASRASAPSSTSTTPSPTLSSAWWARPRWSWSTSGARPSSPRRSRSTTVCIC